MSVVSNKSNKFEAFYTQFKPRSYKKGEMLIRSDDDPQGISFHRGRHVDGNFLFDDL